MRVRAAMQREVELACAQWGIPGRAEIDAAHRKSADMERELRRLRDRVDAMESAARGRGETTGDAPAERETARPVRRPGAAATQAEPVKPAKPARSAKPARKR